MHRPTFHKDELKIVGYRPAPFPMAPDIPVRNSPITSAENLRMLYRGEKPLWMAEDDAVRIFCPRIIPDYIARNNVIEADMLAPSEQVGGADMFGVEWVYVPVARGSMVVPGNPKVPDINQWEKYITFPDLDLYDWEGCAERNRDFLNTDCMISVWIQNGLFERLISFMDMQNALIAMIDEDEQEGVHRLFDRLADFYADIFGRFKKWFDVDIFYFHDDWGSQNAPFFSLDTVREMLVPYLKRIVEAAHSLGCVFEFHSCGKNEMLVPAMIEAGCDAWAGQAINDFALLHEQYGGQIIFEPTPEILPPDAADEEIRAAAQRYVDTYAAGDCIMFVPLEMPPNITQRFKDYVYEFSRIAYCGSARE